MTLLTHCWAKLFPMEFTMSDGTPDGSTLGKTMTPRPSRLRACGDGGEAMARWNTRRRGSSWSVLTVAGAMATVCDYGSMSLGGGRREMGCRWPYAVCRRAPA